MSTAPPELVICRGLPASGKSTAAAEWLTDAPETRARINRDDLRAMLHVQAGVMTLEQENRITAAEEAMARQLLAAGVSVIVDATNLRLRYARKWASLAVSAGATYRVWDLPIDPDEAVERDIMRRVEGKRGTGSKVIRTLAEKFPYPWAEVTPADPKPGHEFTPYVPDITKPEVWLVDIDGTIARKSLTEGSRGWYEYDRVGEDTPIRPIIDLVHGLLDLGAGIVFMSGRKAYCHDTTREWLVKHLGDWTEDRPLFMRADDDERADDIVKSELFDAHVRDHYNVTGVLDDRDRVVAMWRARGLTCLQVADGAF